MTKEELEKEAGEWLKSNIKTEKREGIAFNIVPTPVQIYCAGAEPREKRIEELEQEVLEVRQHLDLTEREWGKDTTKLIHFKTQLTKAKEIISKLLSRLNRLTYTGLNCEECKEAEQFLKEE